MKKFIVIFAFILPLCFSLKGYCAEENIFDEQFGSYVVSYNLWGNSFEYRAFEPFCAVWQSDHFVFYNLDKYPLSAAYILNNSFNSYRGFTPYISSSFDGAMSSMTNTSGLFFPSLDDVVFGEYDDSITLGRFFYTRVDFLGVPLSDKYYIWWGLGSATNVKIEYYNILSQEVYTSFERTNSVILQYSVFNPSDYDIPNNTYVGVRITPLDSNGNYGAIDSIGFIAHSDIVVSEPWSDSPYIEPVLNVNGLDDVRPYINKYTVTTTIPNMPTVPKEQYSPNYIVDVDTTEIERLLQYIIDNMNNNVSDEPQQIIINTPVTYEPVETDFDTPSFKNDFKNWKNGVIDYLMQFNGTPFGEPFAHLVSVILILSGLALALLIIKRL